jgi:hypothetical protein
MKDYKTIGDAAHIFILLNATIFAYAVVMHNESRIFDDVWRPDGFCISNKAVQYFNSHDLCLYFDTIGAIAAGIMYYSFQNTAGMEEANELVKNNIFGIFAHGLGHGGLSQSMLDAEWYSGSTVPRRSIRYSCECVLVGIDSEVWSFSFLLDVTPESNHAQRILS